MKTNIIREVMISSIEGLMAMFAIFVFLEPAVLFGAQDTFKISQTVTPEISFTTPGKRRYPLSFVGRFDWRYF
jgi:hypothetical protein